MSNEMNPYLAAMYNTNGATEQMTEDMQKTANAELFCKLAADNGLDLSPMSDEQIAGVYARVFPEEVQKLAEGAPPFEKKEGEEGKEHEKGESKAEEKKEEEEEDKKEAAAAYFEERQSLQEKCAEGDYIGRIMAHSFTQERENIELAKVAHIVEQAQAEGWTDEQLMEVVKEAAAKELIGKAVKAVKERAGGLAQQRARAMEAGHAAGGELKAHKELLKNLPGKAERVGYKAAPHREGVSKAEHMKELAKMKWKGQAAKAAPYAAGGAVAAGGEEAIRRGLKGKEKKSSAEAFEEIAANHAIKVAEAAGYPVEEAAGKVSAVFTLGLPESEKIAYVQDVDTATHVRGLEYLEAAGYPVNWEEVFPQ